MMDSGRKTIEVVAAVIRDGDSVLATKRGYGEFKDWWEFPGGKIEAGESREEALVREIREELCVGVEPGGLIRAVECDYPAFHLTMHCYWCSLVSADIRLNEHKEARWLDARNLCSVQWLPADKELLPDIARVLNPKIGKVLSWLEANGIHYEIHCHPPLFTIGEALEYWKDIDSIHCKNLFFRNHKGNRHYLVSFECHKELDIHSLEHKLHQGKLSFASPERMDRCLGVNPGSVCAFGLINDIGVEDTADPKELFENGHRVKYYLDSCLQTADRISFHPCDNTASVVLTNDMFKRFLSIWGGEYEWMDIE